MGLSVNILTSGFLVTVVIFFVLMGILFYSAAAKMGEVLLGPNNRANNLQQLKSAYDAARVAYILAFIGAAIALALAVLYAGHEIAFTPSEYWHLALYLITYALLVISVVYAYIALNRMYDLGIVDRNGADSFLWAGLLMAIFAFIGLTATGSGRIGMNLVRSDARNRLEQVEANINTHLPNTRAKIDELHAVTLNALAPDAAVVPAVISPVVPVDVPVLMTSQTMMSPSAVQYVSNAPARQIVTSSLATQGISSQPGSPRIVTPMMPLVVNSSSNPANCV